jgi:hypothetical protein
VNRSIAPTIAATLLLSAAAVGAQVGYLPAKSPYVDLEHSQEFTFIAGEYHAHRDPADVGPQSGMLRRPGAPHGRGCARVV